ncbi:hypothetical protein EVAR_87262_1 [Eumeta japonica]|uniref:Uncharacterized protein n=1 Tax=Eumeta variegata TaxID=151549 RepID=A0A4C1YRA9_EUMVA|nr:hypothetical protein EVAR_87262_1 [Eumeta japonica]
MAYKKWCKGVNTLENLLHGGQAGGDSGQGTCGGSLVRREGNLAASSEAMWCKHIPCGVKLMLNKCSPQIAPECELANRIEWPASAAQKFYECPQHVPEQDAIRQGDVETAN